jgi:RNA polymerase sigma-70 factor, ECF subfamily
MSDLDAHLVERARKGDADAFEALARRHLRAAHVVAVSVLGNDADAEDACQDAFLRALERLEECRDPRRFLAWLLQIVRNRARNLRRAAGVRAAIPIDAVAGAAGRSDPSKDAERAQLREHLRAGLETLSEVQREVVLLHDLEGWRHREIATLLDLPEGTVRYHLSLARRALRARLGSRTGKEE